MDAGRGVPFYYIYGEAPRDIDPGFLHVERVRDREILHHGRVGPHRHAHFHQLSLWTNATGRYIIEGESYPLPKTALTLIPAGAVHGFDIDGEADAVVVSISDNFHKQSLMGVDNKLGDILRRSRLIELTPRAAERLVKLFADIEEEYRFPSWGQGDAIAAYLLLVLVAANRMSAAIELSPRNGRRSALLERFMIMVETNYAERWTIDRYVEALGTTAYLLNSACREGLGSSAYVVLQARIVVEAKRLLLFTTLSVTQIAFTLGHDDSAHFIRLFRANTKISPAAWRREKLRRSG